MPSLTAKFSFLAPGSERPRFIREETYLPDGKLRKPGQGVLSNPSYHQAAVPLVNGRAAAPALTVADNGVRFLRHAPTVLRSSTHGGPGSFLDNDAIVGTHYAETEALLLRELPGASKVVVFDHVIRAAARRDRGEKLAGTSGKVTDGGVQGPVEVVHNDYTEASAVQRIKDFVEKPSYTTGRPPLQGGDLNELLATPFMFVNVWRNIADTPVIDQPLAVFDAQHVARGDLVDTDLIYADRVGGIFTARHSGQQRAVWFPDMRKEEAMILKCFDSRALSAPPSEQRGCWTCHSAFMSPLCPSDKGAYTPRESIEVRTIVFFGGPAAAAPTARGSKL